MAEPPEVAPPRRRVGLASATFVVVASMVGAGVFASSGDAIATLGSRAAVAAAWLAAGLLAMLGALSYGALGRRIPVSGGEFEYLTRTIHPLAGFLAGWVSLLAGFAAPAAAAAGVFEDFAAPWLGSAGGELLLVAAGLAHACGLRPGLAAQNLVVAVKLCLLLGFLAAGGFVLASVGVAKAGPPPPGATIDLASFASVVVMLSFSYSGWNAAVYVASELRDPDRVLPRSLFLGTLCVTLAYVALNLVFVGSLSMRDLASRPDVAANAAEALGGARLETLVRVLVGLAAASSVSVLVFSGPRVYARMAERGLLPRFLVPETGPPRAAILVQVCVALAFLWSGRPTALFGYIGWILSVSTAAAVVGLIGLRLREGARAVPIPGWPLVPVTFVLAVLGIAGASAFEAPVEAAGGLATLAAGALVWRYLR